MTISCGINSCLEHCLNMWVATPGSYALWYNHEHVVMIDDGIDLSPFGYLPLESYGEEHLVSSFYLDADYQEKLKLYFLLNT